GRDLARQPESLIVVGLLDGGGKNALHSDAVAAHDGRDFFSILIEHTRAHRLRVFVAEFEDVPDFYRLEHAQGRPAGRAQIAFGNGTQVNPFGDAEVAARSDVAQVVVLFISAGYQVLASLERWIGKDDGQSI